ncbi:hypothetical protein GCM10027022_08810 [Alpinimonas psychrophila]|uniref:Uncharacterized protein n=1 Tax=Alpinimonas psychrophila TaxID=748908 RepID=A0A7W3JT62_9MICO|nr:hypothetical protein [Alpinimonas psychrophila]MBA8828702.1 hypothetical protein [Alpinimonas psychrophila]
MSMNLTLPSEHDASDLSVFLERAAKLGCEHVRLIGAGSVMAAYVGVLVPSGLLDTAPTVLGLRVFERDDSAALDIVVTIRGMLDRLARITGSELTFALPVAEAGIAWAGVSAPRSDWKLLGTFSAADLEAIARAGIEEIAGSNGLGTIIVTRARREVWGRPISSDPAMTQFVSGAAFAAFGLGFLGEDEPQLSRSANWMRLTTARGHILVR